LASLEVKKGAGWREESDDGDEERKASAKT